MLKRNQPENLENTITESIADREVIEAPPDYVSVFHETKSEFIPSIDKHGLILQEQGTNIGSKMQRRNEIIDSQRPEQVVALGIGRSNIYAYPFLEYGHGLFGADQRFVKRDQSELETSYRGLMYTEKGRQLLQEYGINSLEDFITHRTDPEKLRNDYPGEVIEMKVDPERCYVGDLEHVTRIMEDMSRGLSEKEALSQQAEQYWLKLISLADFLRWYRKPEWSDNGEDIVNAEDYQEEPWLATGFHLLKGAPDNLPTEITTPEILIPEDVPQAHIKLVK